METWAIVAAIAATASAVGTVALALLARGQLRVLRDQVAQGQAGVAAAARSADAADATLRESIHARASESAPRVIVLLEEPEWPPFLDMSRPYVSGGEQPPLEVLGQSQQVDPAREFVESVDSNSFLWFKIRGVVVNEGKGTGRVRIGPFARFVSGDALGFQDIPIPAAVGAVSSGEYRLGPGSVALFEWGDGKPVKDWIDIDNRTFCFQQITVWSFDNATVDYTFVELRGRPLEPGTRPDAWFLSELPGAVGTFVYETRRTFGANAPTPPAPWDELAGAIATPVASR